MALAYYAVTPGGDQNDVTSGTALSHQVALTVVTWDDSEIVTRGQLLAHLALIESTLDTNIVYNSISNASDPRGYLVPFGGDQSDVVWRNATADTDSVLDGAGHVAVEGYTEVNAPKGEILRDLQVIKTAIVQGDFPIA